MCSVSLKKKKVKNMQDDRNCQNQQLCNSNMYKVNMDTQKLARSLFLLSDVGQENRATVSIVPYPYQTIKDSHLDTELLG